MPYPALHFIMHFVHSIFILSLTSLISALPTNAPTTLWHGQWNALKPRDFINVCPLDDCTNNGAPDPSMCRVGCTDCSPVLGTHGQSFACFYIAAHDKNKDNNGGNNNNGGNTGSGGGASGGAFDGAGCSYSSRFFGGGLNDGWATDPTCFEFRPGGRLRRWLKRTWYGEKAEEKA